MKNITTKLMTMLLLFIFVLQLTPLIQAQQADINARIRQEATTNSQIMRTMHYFADVYGPRLTGSPNHKAAAEWAVKQMKEWGFDNVHLEPWDFGHPGWVNERASGFITSPMQDSLVFEVLSWTPSTNGAVSGQAFNLILPDRPTQAEMDTYLGGIKSNIKGRMILVGKPAVIPVNITPPPKRISDEDIKKRFDPNTPAQNFPQRNNQAGGPQLTPKEGALTPGQINEQLDKFLLDNGAAVRVNDAGREHGQIRAFNNRTFDISKTVPTVVMRNEDFGRIARVLADGTPITMEFDIRNKSFPEGKTSYNVVGEITGTDLKDEVIMLGGHLDSWHSATGATDNAIGCATMMEAARILKTLGVKPRRTIRVLLWSGEEEGLLGSQAYVKEHFGSVESPKPGFEKVGGYFNIDSGTGRARGFTIFGPPESAAILREAVAPFADLGVAGAITTKSRGLGGSDNTSFNQAGLPGIGTQQDPIEYQSHTWHTNLDTYERIIPEDAQSSAAVIAAAVYALTMRDGLLPRYAADQMPPAAPAPTPTPATAPTTPTTPTTRPRRNS